MPPDVQEAIRRYADMAYSAARANIEDEYENKLADLRERLALQGLTHSSVMDRETARLYSECVKVLIQARGDALLEAYELYGALTEEAERLIIEDVTSLQEKLTRSIDNSATREAQQWIRRTGHDDPDYLRRAQDFSREVDRLSTPVLNMIACHVTRRRLEPKEKSQGDSFTNIYQLYGNNPRVNVQSIDQSVNGVVASGYGAKPVAPREAEIESAANGSSLSVLAYPPLLRYEGINGEGYFTVCGGMYHLQFMNIRNAQLAVETTANNVAACLEFVHASGDRIFVREGLWVKSGPQVVQSVFLGTNTVEKLAILGVDRDGELFAMLGDGAKKLQVGKWTIRVSITADNCDPLMGEIGFTVLPEKRFAYETPAFRPAAGSRA